MRDRLSFGWTESDREISFNEMETMLFSALNEIHEFW